MSIKLAQILQDYFSHQYVWPRKKHLEKSKKGGNRHTLIYIYIYIQGDWFNYALRKKNHKSPLLLKYFIKKTQEVCLCTTTCSGIKIFNIF